MNANTASHPGRLVGKTAIVTGGEGGIGSAIVSLFVEHGARVISVDVLPEAPEQSVTRQTENAHYRQLNITDEESVQQAIHEIINEFGRVDILVNNAGIVNAGGPAHEATVQHFDTIFNVNVKGTWLLTKHLVPHFIEHGNASIINFSSIAGLVGGTSAQALYHATKGAIRSMTKADAVVYAPHGIRINSVHPGSIDTPMSRATAELNPAGAEAHHKAITAKHPIGRKGHPSEIAYGVLYLASDESSFVTGTELVIDGGYTAW